MTEPTTESHKAAQEFAAALVAIGCYTMADWEIHDVALVLDKMKGRVAVDPLDICLEAAVNADFSVPASWSENMAVNLRAELAGGRS